METGFQKVEQILLIVAAFLIFSQAVFAEEMSIQYEISSDLSWISDSSIYDDYVVNGEPLPAVSGSVDNDYQRISGSFSFFFTPIPENELLPIALQRFYTRSSTLHLSISGQPENEATRIYENLNMKYRAVTHEDRDSRSAGADIEWYLFNNSGLQLSVDSAKDEKTVATSSTLNSQSSGTSDEIRRYYGIGLSQYFFEHFRVNLLYRIFDFEYLSLEKSWEVDSPLLTAESRREADTEGKEITMSGLYILNNRFGFQGVYQYQRYDSHSNTASWYYENFPAGDSYFDDDATKHTVGASIEWYLGRSTTLHLGGSLGKFEVQRTYETDQVVDYVWDIWSIQAGIAYYINRHIGLEMHYDFSKRDGDVETWHPDTPDDPRTTFQADTDVQMIQVEIMARF